MIRYILLFFVIGLELLCLLGGLLLSEAEAPTAAWIAWRAALIFIPIAGGLAVWLMAQRGREGNLRQLQGWAGSLLGVFSTLVWGWQIVVQRNAHQSLGGGMVCSMAVTASMLLASAGLSRLFQRPILKT